MIKRLNSYRKDTLVFEIHENLSDLDLDYMKGELMKFSKLDNPLNIFLLIQPKGISVATLIKKVNSVTSSITFIGKIAYINKRGHSRKLNLIDTMVTSIKKRLFNAKDANNAWKWVGKKEVVE